MRLVSFLRSSLALSITALLLALHTLPTYADIAVIVHASHKGIELTPKEVSRIYLGKIKRLPNKKTVTPLDQIPSASERQQFYQSIITMSEARLKAYWSRLIFTGRGQPPIELENNKEVLEMVVKNPAVVGYIDSAYINDSVHVVLLIPSTTP